MFAVLANIMCPSMELKQLHQNDKTEVDIAVVPMSFVR
jgi:hypothetical protein